jgi:F-type H+-transporting ATPase subunit alpha
MKQPQYSPLSVADMAISLYAANEGYLDDVNVESVVAFEEALHAYAQSNASELIEKINTTGDYDEDIQASLKELLDEFKVSGTY